MPNAFCSTRLQVSEMLNSLEQLQRCCNTLAAFHLLSSKKLVVTVMLHAKSEIDHPSLVGQSTRGLTCCSQHCKEAARQARQELENAPSCGTMPTTMAAQCQGPWHASS